MDKYEYRRLRLMQLKDDACSGSSAELARKIGRDQSYVSRMLYPAGKSGKKRIADDMMEIIESAFNLPRGWIDGRVDDMEISKSNESDQGYLRFELLDISASCGNGIQNIEHPEVIKHIDVLESWARENIGKIDNQRIKVITARGDSMSGTVENGDIVFIDTSFNYFESDGVYVIEQHGTIRIKRLQRLTDGRLAIRSDNNKYETEYISKPDVENIRIAGRALASWQIKKLF